MENEQLLKIIGDRIRIIRKEKGITQDRLSELADLHPTYISDLERGKVNASITTYLKVADALEITPAELLNLPKDQAEIFVGNELVAMIPRLKSLGEKKQTIFIETTKKLLTSLEDL